MTCRRLLGILSSNLKWNFSDISWLFLRREGVEPGESPRLLCSGAYPSLTKELDFPVYPWLLCLLETTWLQEDSTCSLLFPGVTFRASVSSCLPKDSLLSWRCKIWGLSDTSGLPWSPSSSFFISSGLSSVPRSSLSEVFSSGTGNLWDWSLSPPHPLPPLQWFLSLLVSLKFDVCVGNGLCATAAADGCSSCPVRLSYRHSSQHLCSPPHPSRSREVTILTAAGLWGPRHPSLVPLSLFTPLWTVPLLRYTFHMSSDSH